MLKPKNQQKWKNRQMAQIRRNLILSMKSLMLQKMSYSLPKKIH